MSSSAAASPPPVRLWGGRFSGASDPRMDAFNASISYDRRLWSVDLDGSAAYARALARAGVLTPAEGAALEAGLERVRAEWAAGAFVLAPGDEDIHTANERRLTELVGPLGGRLHTGRSRNDQVATDVRLWLRGALGGLRGELLALLDVAVARAEAEVDVLMPGYTHLQPAQPVRWAHWLLSHAQAWARDAERAAEVLDRADAMPLGSGALAGHAFGLDRRALAADLGFRRGPTANSMDAVSDRDFMVEALGWGALTAVHLSRFAEDLIIFSSAEFGFVALSDAYATGSSLMPQKKNPDALELLRGKAGRVIGAHVALLTTLKGLPSTYNKDLQEDKEALFGAMDTLGGTLPIAAGVLATLTPRPAAMAARLAPEMLATDLADYLVRKRVPFRETHHVAGAAVRLAETLGVRLNELTPAQLRTLHPAFGDDVAGVWSFEASVEARSAEGGTARAAVLAQAAKLKAWIATERARDR